MVSIPWQCLTIFNLFRVSLWYIRTETYRVHINKMALSGDVSYSTETLRSCSIIFIVVV